MMNSRKKTAVAATLAAVLALTGCSARNKLEVPVSAPETPAAASDISVSEPLESSNASVSEPTEITELPEPTEISTNSEAKAPATTSTSETKTPEPPKSESSPSSTVNWLAQRALANGSSSNPWLSTPKTETPKTETPKTEAPKPDVPTPVTPTATNSIEDINAVCGLKSEVETSVAACIVDTYGDNPYDVDYDYGKAYEAYIDACDWSLVFDADYYIEKFPLLAMQYHDDKDLLLRHFQTIGIHEGRQGSEKFNVAAYKRSCDSKLANAFGDNYEGYYFYYMLNYSSEKSVDTSAESGDMIQQKTIMTALQSEELDGVNMYRAEVGVADIAFDSELAAFANFRAYLNSHDGYMAHEWFKANVDVAQYVAGLFDGKSIGENTATTTCTKTNCDNYNCNNGDAKYDGYRNSKSHYEAMVNAKNDLIGCGNCYKAPGVVSQFDCFINL